MDKIVTVTQPLCLHECFKKVLFLLNMFFTTGKNICHTFLDLLIVNWHKRDWLVSLANILTNSFLSDCTKKYPFSSVKSPSTYMNILYTWQQRPSNLITETTYLSKGFLKFMLKVFLSSSLLHSVSAIPENNPPFIAVASPTLSIHLFTLTNAGLPTAYTSLVKHNFACSSTSAGMRTCRRANIFFLVSA